MSKVDNRDVAAIQEWLAKEPHLPNNFDHMMLKRFIHSCDGSLERTKKCIDLFATYRALNPEVFNNRDLRSKELQDMIPCVNVAYFTSGEDEVVIHRLQQIPKNFDYNNFLKVYLAHADCMLDVKLDELPKRQVFVFDIKLYTLHLFAKFNIPLLQKISMYLVDAMPVRMGEVHIINCPSFYDVMYNMVKPTLPEYLRQMIHFHTDHKQLMKYIDKKCLPTEYDGEAGSMVEQSAARIKEIIAKKAPYLENNYWSADLAKKATSEGDDYMSGSFRAIHID